MTQQQKDDALMVLGRGCQIRHSYYDPDSCKTCAIGALAKAAGIAKDTLMAMKQNFIFQHLDEVNKIFSKFGLLEYHQRKIQELNDIYIDTDQRTTAVLEYVGSLEVTLE